MIPFNHLGWFFNRFGTAAYPAAIVRELCDALQVVPKNGAVLDLGAGTGIAGNYAHDCRGDLRFTAADPAEGMLHYVPAHVEKVAARAEELPFGDNAFDAIIAGEALHHFDDPAIALREISRVLCGGGMLFVYEFDPTTFKGGMICRVEKLLGEPGNFYAPGTLSGMLEAHGFTVRVSRHRWRYSLHAHR